MYGMCDTAGMVDRATATHLHLDDYPATLTFLSAVFDRNAHDPVGLAAIGYEPTEHGAWVDWDPLVASWLSSKEKALIHIARGTAIVEHGGGPPPRLAAPLLNVTAAVTLVDGRPLATWRSTAEATDG